MIEIPKYNTIDFFEWVKKDKTLYKNITKCIAEKDLYTLKQYVNIYLNEQDINTNINIDIVIDEIISSNEVYREEINQSTPLEVDFLNWAENKNISFYDIQKMPPVIFNALINQYIDTHSLKNIINAKNFIQGYCKGGITPKPFEDVFKRYNAPDVWKCVFLPQKANNILPEFIKKYYDDLKYASRDYLDIFFNKRDLKRTGHLLKYEIKGFDTIPASAIPCIVLWHTDIFQFKYYTFKSYTLDELYTLLIHIIDVIAQGNNDTDVFMEAERMANDISTRHLLNGTTNPHSVTNINVSNSTIGNSLIAGNNDSDVSVVCVKNDNMLNDEISKIVTKINTLDELQQEQKELLSEILENLKNPEKQNESKNIFKGILMGLGSVAAKVKAIITAYPKVAEFLNLN